jgi:predicted nucleic acid-binding protein
MHVDYTKVHGFLAIFAISFALAKENFTPNSFSCKFLFLFQEALIIVEIAGFAQANERETIESDFSGLHTIELTPDIFHEAVTICGKLRDDGLTVPATDAIIAATALSVGAALIHRDSHFENITHAFSLRTMPNSIDE